MATEAGANVSTINLSLLPGLPALATRLSRIPKVLVGILRFSLLLARHRADAVYVGVEGGYGQIYDLAFLVLIRLSGVRLVLHHDSYAYLQERRPLTATVVRIAGPSATHVVGCDDMRQRLIALYGSALRVDVASNVTNIDFPTSPPLVRRELKTIGFISHIRRSKGVLEFLDVAELLCNAKPDVRAVLAGTIADPSLAHILNQRLLQAPQITYVGPVFGEAKSRFYAKIDVFVFPTRHTNEADPRVVSEAMAHGVVVLARGRGCIESILRGGGGTVINESADFIREAERLLLNWYRDPEDFSSMSAAALANVTRMRADNRARLSDIISGLTSIPNAPSS